MSQRRDVLRIAGLIALALGVASGLSSAGASASAGFHGEPRVHPETGKIYAWDCQGSCGGQQGEHCCYIVAE